MGRDTRGLILGETAVAIRHRLDTGFTWRSVYGVPTSSEPCSPHSYEKSRRIVHVYFHVHIFRRFEAPQIASEALHPMPSPPKHPDREAGSWPVIFPVRSPDSECLVRVRSNGSRGITHKKQFIVRLWTVPELEQTHPERPKRVAPERNEQPPWDLCVRMTVRQIEPY